MGGQTIMAAKKAPVFKLADQTGQERTLADLSGPKGLILYVYPKDSTSGCTLEAQEFRDHLPDFKQAGYQVAGLSKDSVKSHQNFAGKHDLGFPLLSDPEAGLIKALGSWGEKKMAGKTYEGIIRSTYVLDTRGHLVKTYAGVKAKGHAAQVLADLADSGK